jgi:hypothetical protein
VYKIISKGWCATKIFSITLSPFDCEQPLPMYFVENFIQAYYLAIMSSSCLHFKKTIFPRDMKQKYWLSKLANCNFLQLQF